jgi:branched-chain amino acid aminotransferase
MDKIVCEYYIIDNMIFKSSDNNYYFNNSEYQFYEVIRTFRGIYLFLDDHLERLQKSLECMNLFQYYIDSEAKKCLNDLLIKNNRKEGNVKLVCKVFDKKLVYAAYYIHHYYPSKNEYQKGIKLKSYIIERKQPNLKQIKVNEFIKLEINDILSSGKFFEVLMVNKKGNITEGSISNFFLIKENTLFSAPENLILKGITRKYIIKIAKDSGLYYIEKDIALIDLSTFDAAFISGTSPKVLPVNQIDEIGFTPGNRYLRLIMQNFDALFDHFIEENINQNNR